MSSTDQGLIMDEVLWSLGWWGRYQRLQFLMMMLPVVPCGLHAMSVVFIGREVVHTCAPTDVLNTSLSDGTRVEYDGLMYKNYSYDNITVTYDTCSVHVISGNDTVVSTNCPAGYKYAEPPDRSFVSQWDLVCDRESLSDVSQTLMALGMLVGAFFFPGLADRYGRKPVYMGTHIILFIVAIAIAFSPGFTVFVVLRFMLGALQQAVGLCSNILIIELLPKERRALPSQVGSFVRPGSLLLLCLMAYITKDLSWQYTELEFAIFSVYVLFQWWITDESLRWLVANNKFEEAEKVLKKAARTNTVDFQKVKGVFWKNNEVQMMSSLTISEVNNNILTCLETPHVQQELKHAVLTAQNPKDEMQFSAFIKNKHIMMVTAISSYMWFADSMTYYGLMMTSSSLTDDLYLGFFLNVLVEIPAGATFALLINRIGRKRCLFIFHILAAAALFTTTVLSTASFADGLPGRKTITLCISLVGKFAVSTGFAALLLYSPELFPTNLRNTGLGLSSTVSRIAGMIAPYSRTLGRHVPWVPGTVFTCLCLLVPVVLRFVPETHGCELPQTIEDIDKWFESKKKSKPKDKE